MRLHAVVSAALLATLAACTENTAPEIKGPSAGRRIIASSGTLDENIDGLLGLFPKGLATAGRNRWGNVKAKYEVGLASPAQMKVAQHMLFELAQWVRDNASEMSTPPNGESVNAAAARLTLYMSQYIYEGPATPPPAFTPGADDAVGLVAPTEPATIVTPTTQAGVSLEAGSVETETIVVITENPTPYPDNCSGPLQTSLCQYPRFYHFNQFPHVRLQKPAQFAVCHVNEGDHRRPLADHDRFRIAHTKPENPDDYTPGSTIREGIEILPLIHQDFAFCDDVEYALNPPTGVTGALTRLAKRVGKLVTPKSAYAIDQGGGGEAVMFSDFNPVDPDGVSDNSVQSVATSTPTTHANDHVTVNYAITNTGTATSHSVPATISFTTPAIEGPPSTTVLATVPAPQVAPGQVTTVSTEIVVPGFVFPGSGSTISVALGDDPTFPDANPENNDGAAAIAIDPSFYPAARRWNVGEASVCALDPGNATYCWGQNDFREFGATGPNASAPFSPTPIPSGLVEYARGTSSQFFCGIRADRSAVCWGRNGFGQLGNGTLFPSPAGPATVQGGVLWNEITTSRLSACGVSFSGVGYCWGSNQRGELGVADSAISVPPTTAATTSSPVVIDGGFTWHSIAAGWLHACGIRDNGLAYCWGDNRSGQLGLGIPDSLLTHRSPAPVAGGLHFIQISASAGHTCGITTDHKAYCWGENFTGQVGNGTTGPDVGTPTQIGAPMRFSYIAAGSDFGIGGGVPVPPGGGQAGVGHTCALTETGEAWCWGWNASGQLGNGTITDSSIPVQVAGGLKFTSIALGGTSTCGRDGNRIWCWGGNEFGQLGIGTFTNVTTPTLIASPFNVP